MKDDKKTEDLSPEAALAKAKSWDPSVVAAGKIIMGLGLVGLALWLSPYTLTELFMVFGIPLLIIGAICFGTGLVGGGFLELVNSKQLGMKLQEYIRAEQLKQQEAQ